MIELAGVILQLGHHGWIIKLCSFYNRRWAVAMAIYINILFECYTIYAHAWSMPNKTSITLSQRQNVFKDTFILLLIEKIPERSVWDQFDGWANPEGCDTILRLRTRETKSTLPQYSLL